MTDIVPNPIKQLKFNNRNKNHRWKTLNPAKPGERTSTESGPVPVI